MFRFSHMFDTRDGVTQTQARLGLGLRGMLMGAALSLGALAAPAVAQDAQTLADIKAELATVSGQLGTLRREMTATGGAGGGFVAGSALDRMNAMESLLAQLTAKTEALEIRINQVVADGTNRIGDLEFRLCEIEPGCDIGALGKTKPLGGATTGGAPAVAAPPRAPAGGAELAVGEKADFDRARGVLDQGDFRSAADLYQTFTETYPGSPLTGEAHYFRGEALMKLGDTAGAARAWLASFSGQPNGPKAADALLNLGMSLNTLGQPTEGCVTLGEVPVRYPGTEAAQQAIQARNSMGCV